MDELKVRLPYQIFVPASFISATFVAALRRFLSATYLQDDGTMAVGVDAVLRSIEADGFASFAISLVPFFALTLGCCLLTFYVLNWLNKKYAVSTVIGVVLIVALTGSAADIFLLRETVVYDGIAQTLEVRRGLAAFKQAIEMSGSSWIIVQSIATLILLAPAVFLAYGLSLAMTRAVTRRGAS